MIRTTAAQIAKMRAAVAAGNAYRNERLWTLLVASLLSDPAKQAQSIRQFCGGPVTSAGPLAIWFEAQPISPRRGVAGNTEGNTKLDLAFGDTNALSQVGVTHRAAAIGEKLGLREAHP